MSDVIISGANGKMGTIVKDIVNENEDFNLVELFDPSFTNKEDGSSSITSLPDADLVIDFCTADSIFSNCTFWVEKYEYIIVGSSGLTVENIHELSNCLKDDQLLWIVPNFSIGSILQKKWSIEASKYYKSVEIEERHHAEKQDYPSRTSYDLASSLKNMSSDNIKDIQSDNKYSIVNNIQINSIRDNQYLAEQGVTFSDSNEKIILDHITLNRKSYMKGISMALQNYKKLTGVCIGLELILGD